MHGELCIICLKCISTFNAVPWTKGPYYGTVYQLKLGELYY